MIYNLLSKEQMLHRFQNFNIQNNLFSNKDKVLVALSGGVDSMVLVHLMSNTDYQFGTAHCNFQLRGRESHKDENFTSQTASSLGVEYHSIKFETLDYAQEQKISIQQAARELRYEWFQSLCVKYGYTKIATAHQASDQTETVFYNLTKGCGVSGLRGIPIKNNNIVRPLLFASRKDIIDYAKQNEVKWREDSSNTDEKYKRNLIRHSVIPKLVLVNPGIDRTMIRNTNIYRDVESYLKRESKKILQKYAEGKNKGLILSTEWIQGDEANKVLLYEVIRKYGFNYDQTDGIFKCIAKHPGKKFFSDTFTLIVDRDRLYVLKTKTKEGFQVAVEKEDKEFQILGAKFEIQVVGGDGFKVVKKSAIACLDYDKLSFPLKVRNWREGDRFVPLGMRNKKKLSDFMIDEKIPVNLKSRVILIESAGEIVWLAGYRIDDRFKVTNETKRVLLIEKSNV